MKIKAGETVNMFSGLVDILKIKMPMKPAYWLARIADRIESERKAFLETRMKLIKQHAKKDKKGEPMFKKDKDGNPTLEYDIPDVETYNKEFDELVNQEIEININPVKLSDIDVEVCEKCGRKKLTIEPVILAKLGKIIEI